MVLVCGYAAFYRVYTINTEFPQACLACFAHQLWSTKGSTSRHSVAVRPANKKHVALWMPVGEIMASQEFLLVYIFLLPTLAASQRHPGGHSGHRGHGGHGGGHGPHGRDGKYIERVQARFSDFKRGEIKNNWLPQKEPEGFNILLDALKKWRPSSTSNFVKVSHNNKAPVIVDSSIHMIHIQDKI